jgi:hypothetical protein
MVEFGEAGDFQIGTVVSVNAAGKVVRTTANQVYGIIAEVRLIVDINSERLTAAQVVRRGSFKADELIVADDTSLRVLAPRMRELGMYLEGLEATLAAPFRITRVNPTIGEVNMQDVRLDVWVDGSIDDSARIFWDQTEQASSTVLDHSHVWCTIPALGATVRVVKVWVAQTPWRSNEVNFAVVPATGVLPPPAPLTGRAAK